MKSVFLTLFVLATYNLMAQKNFNYKHVPSKHTSFLRQNAKVNNIKSYYAANLKYGSKDNTDKLQTIVNKFDSVVLPNKDIYINKKGIFLDNNSILIGRKKTRLIMVPNNRKKFAVLNIHNVKNVTVKNIRIIGDREKRSDIKGEWGHGISIKGSSKVKLENLKIEKTIGDGIYIGRKNRTPSNNVFIKDIFIDNVRRNGLSITSGKDITIKSLFISNSSGTKPMFGLDIEPNSNRDFIKDIKIKNLITYNNARGGLNININKLGRGNIDKIVNIKVSNFWDFYSPIGFRIGNVTLNPEQISGCIALNDIELNNNYTPFKIKSSKAKNLFLKIFNLNWGNQERKAFTKERVFKGLVKRKNITIKP